MTESASEGKLSAFTYEVVRKFTGKIQYRQNDRDSITSPFGITRRGEVKEVKNKATADSLVENGDFAHVPADTPVGVPESVKARFTPKKRQTSEPAQPQGGDQPQSNAGAGAGEGQPQGGAGEPQTPQQ